MTCATLKGVILWCGKRQICTMRCQPIIQERQPALDNGALGIETQTPEYMRAILPLQLFEIDCSNNSTDVIIVKGVPCYKMAGGHQNYWMTADRSRMEGGTCALISWWYAIVLNIQRMPLCIQVCIQMGHGMQEYVKTPSLHILLTSETDISLLHIVLF